MTVSRKAALSLLIAAAAFAAFAVLSWTGLFGFIEARFYNPAVTKQYRAGIAAEAETIGSFLSFAETSFTEALNKSAVKRSFLVNQSDADIEERSLVFSALHDTLGALQWARFIDVGGNRIHYSTFKGDLLREEAKTAVYRMYTDAAFYTPMELLLPASNENIHIVFDGEGQRILFSMPFFDALDAYRGIAVFSLSQDAVESRLTEKYGQGKGALMLVDEPCGFLRGFFSRFDEQLGSAAAASWAEGILDKRLEVGVLESQGGRVNYVLLSQKTAQGFFVGRIVDETLFAFPIGLKVLLLLLFFLSIFLLLFLIFNITQDPLTVVQHRLKNLQINILEEYYDQKTDVELKRWGLELVARREKIREEIKTGLKLARKKTADEKSDKLIDKTWNEILAAIGGRLERTVNEEEISLTLGRLNNTLTELIEKLKTESASPPQKTQPKVVPPAAVSADKSADVEEAVEVAEAAEELEPLEEAEALEVLEEAEELEALEEAPLEEIAVLEEAPAEAEPVEEAEIPLNKHELEAQRIEFETKKPIKIGPPGDEPLAIQLDVVSPFGSDSSETIGNGFKEVNVFEDDETQAVKKSQSKKKNEREAEKEEAAEIVPEAALLRGHGLAFRASALRQSFSSGSGNASAGDEGGDAGGGEGGGDSFISMSESGISYIQDSVLHPSIEDEQDLDPRIKGLVDSVLQ